MPPTAGQTTKTETEKVPAGLRTGELLALYDEALRRDTHYPQFVEQLMRLGGYRTEQAARQRLTRFRAHLAKRSLQLKPLKGSTLRTRDNLALKSQFSCLMDAGAVPNGRDLGMKRRPMVERKKKKDK